MLAQAVVQFGGNTLALALLRLDQLTAHARHCGFGPFALCDVEKGNHGPNNLVTLSLRIRPIFNRKTCPICPPHYLVPDVNSFPGLCHTVNSTLFYGERSTVCTSVMDQIMHLLAEQFVAVLVPQSAQAGLQNLHRSSRSTP